MIPLSEEDDSFVCQWVMDGILKAGKDTVTVSEMHNFVEEALEELTSCT